MRVVVIGALVGALWGTASAAPHWPFDFDPSIAADPTGTGAKITTGNASYPEMPIARMTALHSDAVTLYFWPESAAMLERARASATNAPMVWPLTSTVCAAHAAFSIPTLLTANPSSACTAADTAIRTALANLSACSDVELPELYARAYDPANARATSSNLVDMIGQAGQAFTHADAPQIGLLPDDFVPRLRTILAKLRHDTLVTHLTTAHAAYEQALAKLASHAACFDATAAASTTTGLHALETELDGRTAYLAQLQTSGATTVAQEAVCLAATSHVRNTLTYPTLTRAEREWLAFWVGGTYWRMRGGGLIPLGSTQDARWYFVNIAFGQLGSMLGGQDGIDAAFQLYTPLLFTGWSAWQDMGQGAGADKYDDLVSMTSRGETQVHGAVSLLAGRGYTTLDLTVGGLLLGPGYYRGYYPMQDFRYAAQFQPEPPYSDGISGPTAIGEFSFGANLGLGLAHTLLDGKATGAPPTVTLCTNAVCGDDGCGGSCGTCGDGTTCSAGACIVAPAGDAGVPPSGDAGHPDQATGTSSGGCCDAGGRPAGSAFFAACVGFGLIRRRRR